MNDMHMLRAQTNERRSVAFLVLAGPDKVPHIRAEPGLLHRLLYTATHQIRPPCLSALAWLSILICISLAVIKPM